MAETLSQFPSRDNDNNHRQRSTKTRKRVVDRGGVGYASNDDRENRQRIVIELVDKPIVLKIPNTDQGVATLVISKEGVKFMGHHAKRESERQLSWSVLARLMEVGF